MIKKVGITSLFGLLRRLVKLVIRRIAGWLGWKRLPGLEQSHSERLSDSTGNTPGISLDKAIEQHRIKEALIGELKDSLREFAPQREVPERPDSPVECTVFAPPAVQPGENFLLQVFVHKYDQSAQAQRLAAEFDENTSRRGFCSLAVYIELGSVLGVHLLLPELTVDNTFQQVVWNGRADAVQFEVKVPKRKKPGTIIGTVIVSRDTVPIGHIKFKISVQRLVERPRRMPTGQDAMSYKKAFISYASKDRNEVLRRVQMLKLLRIDFFQDLLHLEPGDRWEKKLYVHIDESDLFLLFWSSSAKGSKWVRKELQYALQRKATHEFSAPEIIPVIIEGPPLVPPPRELAYLHFNDPIIYFMCNVREEKVASSTSIGEDRLEGGEEL